MLGAGVLPALSDGRQRAVLTGDHSTGRERSASEQRDGVIECCELVDVNFMEEFVSPGSSIIVISDRVECHGRVRQSSILMVKIT